MFYQLFQMKSQLEFIAMLMKIYIGESRVKQYMKVITLTEKVIMSSIKRFQQKNN